jgi:nucleotide-binding universal stress UspA family protein
MDQFRKIMVALDHTEMDEILVKYAALFMNTLQAGSLTFVHIFEKDKNPVDPHSKNSLEFDLRSFLETKLKEESFSWEITFLKGEVHDELLHAIDKNDIDLLILGRKHEIRGSGSLPQKTVKRCHSSVLFIPEEPFHHLQKVLVPVDFSDYSLLALKQALFLISQNNGQVICQHIYEVPSGYHRTGKDYHEFAEIMKGHAINDTKVFLKKHNLPSEKLTFIYTLDKEGKPAKKIFKYAQAEKIDIICLGSKGRTAAASMVLGSVAENIVEMNGDTLLLVVKTKEENLGFFDAISKL